MGSGSSAVGWAWGQVRVRACPSPWPQGSLTTRGSGVSSRSTRRASRLRQRACLMRGAIGMHFFSDAHSAMHSACNQVVAFAPKRLADLVLGASDDDDKLASVLFR
jgi:hypothetical protein